jgi:hypothetical protein
MGKLRPIGSEKLQGIEKLNRILEISRYKENTPKPVNESSSKEYNVVLANGVEYSIDKEKNGYVLKKRIDESTFDYVESMKNRNYYRSYSQALKRLNLITKEINSLVGNNDGQSLFTEQKKFVLKTPKSDVPPPTEEVPSPSAELPTPSTETPSPSPEGGEETGMEDMPVADEGGESPEEPMDMESPEGGEEPMSDDASFKGIQKLTGKLTQKIRTSDEEEMTPENIKYIINSILSAIDLDKLEDEDKEEIMSKFEGEEEMAPSEDEGEVGMEEPQEPVAAEESELYEISDSEMDGSIAEKLGSAVSGAMVGAKLGLKKEGEIDEDKFYETIYDGIFAESKVDKILSKYFQISESEKKELNRKKMIQESKVIKNKKNNFKEIERLSESEKQLNVAKEVIKKYSQAKVIGLTNMKNLVIEHKGEQIRITPKGQIL